MSEAKPLSVRKNFLGSDVVISDFKSEEEPFRAIFVNWAEREAALEAAREKTKQNLLALLK